MGGPRNGADWTRPASTAGRSRGARTTTEPNHAEREGTVDGGTPDDPIGAASAALLAEGVRPIERLRILRTLGLLVDHTGPDERVRIAPEGLAGEFGLDLAQTRAAYARLAAIGALRPTLDGWVVPGASRLHGQQLRPADALDTIARVLADSGQPQVPTAPVEPAARHQPAAPHQPAPPHQPAAPLGPYAPAPRHQPAAPLPGPYAPAPRHQPAAPFGPYTPAPRHQPAAPFGPYAPAAVEPYAPLGPSTPVPVATLPVPGVPAGRHDWSARRLRTSVLAAAALVVAVGVGSLAIDSRGSADLPLATGPGTPSATGVPPAADRDAHPEPAVAGPTPSRGAPSPTAPDPSSTTADLTPGTATPAPAPTRPAPNTPAAGPLAASPPGELVCPTHPPQVAVTATAVSPDLERVGGWVLVVRGTLEGHPDRDALVEQVLARITVHGSDIEAQALDAPLPVAAGDRLRWQAELRVPPGAAPPRPDAELGPWHWSDPGLAACP